MKFFELDFESDKTYYEESYNEYWKVIDGDLYLNETDGALIHDIYSMNMIKNMEFYDSKYTGWEVNNNKIEEMHYSIGADNDIYETRSCIPSMVNNLNCFSTREKAEEVSTLQLKFRKIMKFRDENDSKWDEQLWGDLSIAKYTIAYDYLNREYVAATACGFTVQGAVYFSSREIAERCIEEILTIKEDNINEN